MYNYYLYRYMYMYIYVHVHVRVYIYVSGRGYQMDLWRSRFPQRGLCCLCVDCKLCVVPKWSNRVALCDLGPEPALTDSWTFLSHEVRRSTVWLLLFVCTVVPR